MNLGVTVLLFPGFLLSQKTTTTKQETQEVVEQFPSPTQVPCLGGLLYEGGNPIYYWETGHNRYYAYM